MNYTKILASLITFNPDLKNLEINLNALCMQVDEVLIFDNASENIDALRVLLKKYNNLKLCTNSKNIGLPINYNRAAKYCQKHGYEWLLIMDQDTLVEKDFVEKLKKYTDSDVAIICPLYRDINLYSKEEFLKTIPNETTSFVNWCISSASLNRVSTLLSLGGFDEKLFIDQVDVDYCRNLQNHGYKILRVNDCIIEHAIGESKWVKILGKKTILYNHSPFRKYYIFRNKVYIARKYHYTLKSDRGAYKNFILYLLLIFYEKDKLKKFHAAFKGLRDGFKMPIN